MVLALELPLTIPTTFSVSTTYVQTERYSRKLQLTHALDFFSPNALITAIFLNSVTDILFSSMGLSVDRQAGEYKFGHD